MCARPRGPGSVQPAVLWAALTPQSATAPLALPWRALAMVTAACATLAAVIRTLLTLRRPALRPASVRE